MRVNVSHDEGSPEWYAMKAIEAMDLPQRKAIPKCVAAIFAGLGAALDGKPEQAEKLISEGKTYFEMWAAVTRQHCASMTGKEETVQKVEPSSITKNEAEDFDLGEDDL